MSYINSQKITLNDKNIGGTFAGGFVDNINDSEKSNSYASYLRNARLNGQNIEIRPGFDLFNNELTEKAISIGTYIKIGNSDKLIIRENQDVTHKIITLDELSTKINIDTNTNITSDNRMHFLQGGNDVYCMNGVDKLGKLNGTTYSIVTTGLAFDFKPKIGVIWSNCSWYTGTIGYENKVYKSTATSLEDLNSAGSQIITFNEEIVGFGTSNQTLYLFGKNTISAIGQDDISNNGGVLTFNTRVVNVKEGAINHQSIVSVGMDTYYITPSNKIQKLIRGTNNSGYEVLEVSHRKWKGIDNIMESLDSDQLECFGIFLPKENLIKWHLKKEGSTINDIIIVYDIILNKFLIDEGKYFNGSAILNGQQYSISAIEGKVYKDEYSQTDENSIIDFEYQTKEFDFGNNFIKKVLWESITSCAINELTELTQEIYIDGNLVDTKIINKNNIQLNDIGIGTIGIGEEGIGTITLNNNLQIVDIYRTKGNLNKRGQKIKWVFKCNSIGAKLSLQMIQARIEILSELTNNLTI